ncbi:hypothetical protein SGLAM104S_08670 [Streptomyces glaucescens]
MHRQAGSGRDRRLAAGERAARPAPRWSCYTAAVEAADAAAARPPGSPVGVGPRGAVAAARRCRSGPPTCRSARSGPTDRPRPTRAAGSAGASRRRARTPCPDSAQPSPVAGRLAGQADGAPAGRTAVQLARRGQQAQQAAGRDGRRRRLRAPAPSRSRAEPCGCVVLLPFALVRGSSARCRTRGAVPEQQAPQFGVGGAVVASARAGRSRSWWRQRVRLPTPPAPRPSPRRTSRGPLRSRCPGGDPDSTHGGRSATAAGSGPPRPAAEQGAREGHSASRARRRRARARPPRPPRPRPSWPSAARHRAPAPRCSPIARDFGSSPPPWPDRLGRAFGYALGRRPGRHRPAPARPGLTLATALARPPPLPRPAPPPSRRRPVARGDRHPPAARLVAAPPPSPGPACA